jgi:hypothetical protein
MSFAPSEVVPGIHRDDTLEGGAGMRRIQALAVIVTLGIFSNGSSFAQGGSGSARVEPVLAHNQAMQTMERLQKMLNGLQEKLDKLATEPASPESTKKIRKIRRNMETYRARLDELDKEMDTTYRNLMSDESKGWQEPEAAEAGTAKGLQEAPTCPANCNCPGHKH